MVRQNKTNEFLSVTEIATKMRCRDRRSVYHAIYQGRLHAIRLVENGPWRIPRKSWEKFVAGEKR